jgi:hypothetical protein
VEQLIHDTTFLFLQYFLLKYKYLDCACRKEKKILFSFRILDTLPVVSEVKMSFLPALNLSLHVTKFSLSVANEAKDGW